VGFLV